VTDGISIKWSADHLRASLFSNALWPISADVIFSEVFGYPPETTIKKAASNEVSATGNWEGLIIEVKSAFNRLDFTVTSTPSESEPLPFIKEVQPTLMKLTSTISKWASSQPQELVRIAIGCNAFLQAQNVEDSYSKLKSLIQVIEVDVDRFKEFRFQVNLPITSSISNDISINRLSHWSSIGLRAALIGIDSPNYFNETHYVSCSLDVNTSAERTYPINRESIEKLTEELSQTCIEILETGIS
jgi:hypothetical protein